MFVFVSIFVFFITKVLQNKKEEMNVTFYVFVVCITRGGQK